MAKRINSEKEVAKEGAERQETVAERIEKKRISVIRHLHMTKEERREVKEINAAKKAVAAVEKSERETGVPRSGSFAPSIVELAARNPDLIGPALGTAEQRRVAASGPAPAPAAPAKAKPAKATK